MKLLLTAIAVLATSSLLHAQNKAALNEISAFYDQIEADFKSWSHSAMTVGNDSGGFTNDLRQSHDDDKLMKLQTRSYEDHGETTLQFFFKGGRRLFKKLGSDSLAYTRHDVGLVQRSGAAVVTVEVDAQIPKSEEDTYFACTITFKLESDENGGAPKLTWSGTERHHD